MLKAQTHHEEVQLTQLGAVQVRAGELGRAVATLEGCADFGYGALHLGYARLYLGETEAAARHFAHALDKARGTRDGVLAIAALCAQGEVALGAQDAGFALKHFGRALGLTELSGDEALSVAPLAGLAQAHALRGNAIKAEALGSRALRRAQAGENALGRARALLSLGFATGAPVHFDGAICAAQEVPHRPLELRARIAHLERQPDLEALAEVKALARVFGMRPEAQKLGALEKQWIVKREL